MRIGLDIDNTVLDYSDAFRASASSELGVLIPSTHGKILIKQQVIEVLGPSAWTKLQDNKCRNSSDEMY